MSGPPDVSNSFVSPSSNSFTGGVWLSQFFVSRYSNSFVSQSLPMSPIHLFPHLAIYLSPSVAGGVWLSGCLSSLVSRLACGVRPSGQFPRFLHLLSGCLPLVFHLSPRCGFPDVVSQLPPRFLRLLSSCLPLVSQCGLPIAFHNSHCLPELVFQLFSKCLPFVAPLFPSCLSDVASHLSPSCLAFVLQMWSSNCLRVCSRCALPILSQLSST